jgi:hypothetical protein
MVHKVEKLIDKLKKLSHSLEKEFKNLQNVRYLLKIQIAEFNSTIKSTQTTVSIEKAQSIRTMKSNTKITKIHLEPREKSRNYQYMFKIQEISHDSYTSKKNANTDISEDKIENDLKCIKKVLKKTVTSKIVGAVCKKKEEKRENILALKHCIPLLRNSRIEAVNIDVECETMQNFIISHSNKVENLKSSFHKMFFRYNDPENDFNRNRVKGVISFLFSSGIILLFVSDFFILKKLVIFCCFLMLSFLFGFLIISSMFIALFLFCSLLFSF